MPDIGIVKDEMYPWYGIADGQWSDATVTLTEDELATIRKAQATFEAAQEILHRAYNAAR